MSRTTYEKWSAEEGKDTVTGKVNYRIETPKRQIFSSGGLDLPDVEKKRIVRLAASAPRMLAILEELSLCPNKIRPDWVWEEVNAAIKEAKGE